MNRYLIGAAGIVVILLIAFLLSSDKRAIRLRVVGAAFALQAGIAVLVIYVPAGQAAIHTLSEGVIALLGYAGEGTKLILGPLATDPKFGSSFAISALPVIIFFAALVSVLYHIGIMQLIVRWIGGAIELVTGVSKVESLCAAANIFVGQSESPLVIRPYLARLSEPQMFAVMSVGMAGVAGTILAAYAGLFGDHKTEVLPFLLAASFMSAPGGLLMAKIIMPDDESILARDAAEMSGVDPEAEIVLPDARISAEGPAALTESGKPHEVEVAETFEEGHRPANIIEAAAQGTQTGVKLAVAVGAMVMVFVALVALANGILGGIGAWFGYPDVSFQQLLGFVFAPVMFLIGIPWEQAGTAGGLFGTKIVLNEFVAFIDLGAMDASVLPDRSRAIVTFALCGFANFSSIAIQMAVTGGLAPNQRPVIAKLGIRALAAGSLANLMSAALAGLFLPY